MNDDAIAILNLLHIYAERVDQGDFAGAGDLFEHAEVTIRNQATQGPAALREFWRNHIRVYENGTSLAKHVITNPVIEFSDDGARANVRSCWTVMQATPDLPLQIISTGRYHDVFEKVDGAWRFASRVFGGADLAGNFSAMVKA